MPILNLKISGKDNPEQTQNIVHQLTQLTEKHLKKKPEWTSITVQYIDHKNWFVHTQNLEQHNKNSFYLDIKVTGSTNVKSEKEDFITAVYDMMSKVLGKLHSESYIYIEEVLADAYGFGGKTQEFRYIKNKG